MNRLVKVGQDFGTEVERICREESLVHPMSQWNCVDKFEKAVSKARAEMSPDGRPELEEIQFSLEGEVSHARLAIGCAHFWHRQGLASFRRVQRSDGVHYMLMLEPVDAWYFHSLDHSFSRLYNCWDRIAGLLNFFFNVKRRTRSTTTTFDPIVHGMGKMEEMKGDPDLNWLLSFRTNEYKKLVNKHRRRLVHKSCSSSAYFRKFLRRNRDADELADLQNERDSLPQALVAQYGRVLDGVGRVFSLVSKHGAWGLSRAASPRREKRQSKKAP